jgi:hypothetical protein
MNAINTTLTGPHCNQERRVRKEAREGDKRKYPNSHGNPLIASNEPNTETKT